MCILILKYNEYSYTHYFLHSEGKSTVLLNNHSVHKANENLNQISDATFIVTNT
jgi:hypothetical protein